jgi:succinate--hydroxymethylglutarate CoA-transferase
MCNKEKFSPLLCRAIERPVWIEDPDFRSFAARLKHRARLTEMLDAVLAERSTAEWLERFAGTVPAAPVNDLASALDNPWVRERGMVWPVPHPARADFRLLGSPIATGDRPPAEAAPPLGRDTEAILKECGFSAERIAALHAARVTKG